MASAGYPWWPKPRSGAPYGRLGRAVASTPELRSWGVRSSRNAHTSYSSHVTSVRPIANGPTATLRGPRDVGTVTGPAGTGTVSKRTSVPGIESRFGGGGGAFWTSSSSDILPAMCMRTRLLVTVTVLAGSTGDARAQEVRREFAELHMGVAVRIELYAPDDGTARTAARVAYARIAKLEDIMSDYRAESEVRRLAERPDAAVPGREIVVGDPPPGRAGWRVAVPGGGEAVRGRAGALAHAALSLSGDTEQYVIVAGVRYSHVVDPRTGVGLTSRRQAAVVAEDGLTADGLATALTVLDDTGQAALLRAYPGVVAEVRRVP